MLLKTIDPWWKHFRENPVGWEVLLLFLLGMIVLLFIMDWIAYTT